MENQFALMLDKLHTYTDVSTDDLELLKNAVVPCSIKRGEYLVKEGEICQGLGFVTKGIFRVYALQEIEEKTIHFVCPGDFTGAFSSFISQSPSNLFVQAVTDVEFLSLSYKALNELYDRSHKLERLGRLIVEALFLAKDNRVISFIKYNASERYQKLIEKQPEIAHHVPLQYIASYLAIKPETLSRIRAKKI